MTIIPVALIKGTLRTIAKQTDQNDHNGSNLTLAQFIGDMEAISQIEALQAKHQKAGYMEPSWIQERTAINKALLAQVHLKYGTEVRDLFYKAF